MITVPSGVLDALKAPARQITSKVELTLPNNVIVDLTSDLIAFDQDLTVSSDNGAIPFGCISYNNMVITLDNIEKKYILNNANSPYYGLLRAGCSVVVTYYVLMPDASLFSIPGGLFYTDTWKAATNDSTATLTCYDTLKMLGDKPLIPFQMACNITALEAFTLYLRAQGLKDNQFSISSRLTTRFDYLWPQGTLMVEGLEAIAKASGANVFCDTDGKIKITPVWKETPSVMSIRESDLILNTKADPSYKEAYAAVQVTYKQLESMEVTEVYNNRDVSITVGESILTPCLFSKIPVVAIAGAIVTGTKNIVINKCAFTDRSGTLYLANRGESISKASIRILGTILNTKEASVTAKNPQAIGSDTLQIDCPYIISETEAMKMANVLVALYSGTTTNVTLDVRVLPTLELYDKITLNNPKTGIIRDFYISKITIDYSNGLIGTLTLSAAAETVLKKYCFIAPGLAILL